MFYIITNHKNERNYTLNQKDAYHYESFINDVHARDAKRNLLKAKGYKEIKIGQYVCATGEVIYFVTWE